MACDVTGCYGRAMAADPGALSTRGSRWEHLDVALLAVAFLSALLIPIHIGDIYSGLPAHPLFLHVPVILIPLVTIASVALVARVQWLVQYGLLVAAVAVVALIATVLTMGAGTALADKLSEAGRGGEGGAFAGSTGRPDYISQHADAARLLRILMFLFVIGLIVLVLSDRVGRGLTRLGRVGELIGRRPSGIVLRIGVVVLAIACFVQVIRVGDLGAKAVWLNRTGGGGPGGFGSP
jgi:hypothetical protein